MAFRDIRKSRRRLSPQEIGIIVLVLFILSTMLALNVYVSRITPGGEWLYLRWNSVRSFLSENFGGAKGSKFGRLMPEGSAQLLVTPLDLYGKSIARSVQQLVYGREASAAEYRYVLSDPFYIVLLYSPIAFLPEFVDWLVPAADADFQMVRGVWMLLAEIALIVIIVFCFSLSEWEPPRGLFFLLLSLGLLNFFSLNALLTASPTIFLTLLYLGVLLALRSSSDELAGALLLLVAYQWEVSGLFFLSILIYVFTNRRWNVLAGFGMALVVVLIVSFLSYSGWGLPYIRAVLSNFFQGFDLNLNHILLSWLPPTRISISGIISILLILIVIIESIASARSHFRRVFWTAALALAATPLVGLAIFPSNFVVLLPSLILILALVWERWSRWRALRVTLILLPWIAVPFFFYVQTVYVYSPLYTDLLSVLPPFAAILGLYWMRWWVVRSPRIWAEQIGLRR
jgi:hypothetical protein